MSETGPLPAQPYILVLWATHIGRYAIKHSPSGARERAIVKVLGTLCEHPLPLFRSLGLCCLLTLSRLLIHLSSLYSSTLSLFPSLALFPVALRYPLTPPAPYPIGVTCYHPSRALALTPLVPCDAFIPLKSPPSPTVAHSFSNSCHLPLVNQLNYEIGHVAV